MEAGRREAGCDEAGRGPLAGPVYAAAVILPPDFFHPLLNDSKQMSEKQREELRPIIEREAVFSEIAAYMPPEQTRTEQTSQGDKVYALGMLMRTHVLGIDCVCDRHDRFVRHVQFDLLTA